MDDLAVPGLDSDHVQMNETNGQPKPLDVAEHLHCGRSPGRKNESPLQARIE